ncbi:copine family protein 1-like isoform X2 [Mya arenaria]|uniref:copine family protein 1-like isoform X2 n=1 Tax=Mya arenaria TaxID=6604 RepID=UPI0022E688A3|nr:copine family protein 1-like isoform X2 [Mya arenaria]
MKRSKHRVQREDSSMFYSDSVDSWEELDSRPPGGGDPAQPAFVANTDHFETLEEVSKAIKDAGVDKCGLIFGIDYTLSNKVQGERTFGGRNLHAVESGRVNPYQEVICIMGETLEPLDDDGIIPVYGFGDRVVKDIGIFPLKKEGECDGFAEVLDVYDEIAPDIKLGGPTNFAPLIQEAVAIVRRTKQYHILVIVADGQVTSEEETIAAIVAASEYPLSIVVIGIHTHIIHKNDLKLSSRNIISLFLFTCKG